MQSTKNLSLFDLKCKFYLLEKTINQDEAYNNDENTPEKVNYADNEGYIHDDNNMTPSLPEEKRTKKKAKFKLNKEENL